MTYEVLRERQQQLSQIGRETIVGRYYSYCAKCGRLHNCGEFLVEDLSNFDVLCNTCRRAHLNRWFRRLRRYLKYKWLGFKIRHERFLMAEMFG